MPSREEMGIHLVHGYLFGKPGPIVLSKRDPIDRISKGVGGPPPPTAENGMMACRETLERLRTEGGAEGAALQPGRSA